MKRFTILICSMALVAMSCNNSGKAPEHTGALASSVGKINDLSVIIDNDLWQSRVGDTLRHYLGGEVPGLPQEEPLFSMRQMAPDVFTGFAQKGRIYIKVNRGEMGSAEIVNNKYASPQLGVELTGKNDDEIIDLIKQNAESIIAKYKIVETREKQKRIRKSLERIPQLKQKFGFNLDIPSAYRIAIEEDQFFWIRKDIKHGSMNLMVYQVPLNTIKKDSNTVGSIIRMRDSIGAIKIPTSAEGKFITEEAYAPYLFETKLDGRFAFETKGTWEIKDRYMAGPFVNYAIDDTANNRTVVLEGFVFAPSAYKRDNMFELEAIMKSIKFD